MERCFLNRLYLNRLYQSQAQRPAIREVVLKNQYGYSLLETIISLGLITIILSLMFKELLFQLKFNTNFSNYLLEQKKVTVLEKYLEDVVENQNSFRFVKTYKIHPLGKVTFSDNSENIISTHKTLSPKPNSKAISSAKILFKELMSVKESQNFVDGVSILTCFTNQILKQSFSAKDIKSYLAITSDGAVELVGSLVKKDNSCYEGILAKNRSIIFEQPKFLTIKYLVPIRSISTIYLSKENELRFLGHSGENNIENQPILKDLSGVNFRERNILEQKNNLRIDYLETEISLKEKNYLRTNFFNLSLKNYHELLLTPIENN